MTIEAIVGAISIGIIIFGSILKLLSMVVKLQGKTVALEHDNEIIHGRIKERANEIQALDEKLDNLTILITKMSVQLETLVKINEKEH